MIGEFKVYKDPNIDEFTSPLVGYKGCDYIRELTKGEWDDMLSKLKMPDFLKNKPDWKDAPDWANALGYCVESFEDDSQYKWNWLSGIKPFGFILVEERPKL